MTSCSCQHAQIQVAYRMHLEMGAKQGAFQRRCLGEERHRFRPHSQSVIANLRPPLYVAQCGLQHGDCHASGIVSYVSVLTAQTKADIASRPAAPRIT